MPFVVVDAARVHGAVAHRRLVRRGLPEVQRHRGLHVVVLDADESPLAGAGLPHDERWRAIDPELVRRRAGGDEALAAPARRGVERAEIRRLRGARAQLAQLGDEPRAVLLDIPVEHVGHDGSMSWTDCYLSQSLSGTESPSSSRA